MIFLILLVKIIFFVSLGGIFLLFLKKLLKQKQEREKLYIFLQKIFQITKNIIALTKQYGKRFIEFLFPKIKNFAFATFQKILQITLNLRNFLKNQMAKWKKELKPVHFSKEKKEFLAHLWEKVNNTKTTQIKVKELGKEPTAEISSIPKDINKNISQTEKILPKDQPLKSFTPKPAFSQPKVPIFEDPIKRDILLKQEQSILKLIVSKPKDFNLYKKLGFIYKELGNLEDARNCFEYALKLGAKDREIQKELELLK